MSKNCIMLTVNISKEERYMAKKLAKSKGMSFGVFIGILIKNELVKNSSDYGKFNQI